MKSYFIDYLKDGKKAQYHIPAETKENALVRLGQIYGDKESREDIEIEVISVTTKQSQWGV